MLLPRRGVVGCSALVTALGGRWPMAAALLVAMGSQRLAANAVTAAAAMSGCAGRWRQALQLQTESNVVTRNVEMSCWTQGSHFVPGRRLKHDRLDALKG